ncbi:MAG: T9SS type A sorting domain-containing protein [Bacteroidetes bacterium]|nr:MAG: T9SS type A sorting domain-containing protein [Bacteroidota bacterium]
MKTLFSIFVILVFTITLTFYSYSQNKLILKDVFILEKNLNEIQKNGVSILLLNHSINFKNLNNVSELIMKNFPISNVQTSDVKLKLTNSIIDNKTLITTGDNIRMNLPLLSRFKGTIFGEVNSEVFITFIDNTMYCNIKRENNEEFTILPSTINQNEYIISDKTNNISEIAMNCGSVEPIDLANNMMKYKKDKILSDKTLQVDIAIDMQYYWYSIKFPNDSIKIRNYILSVYSMISYIYEKEMNITVHIPWLHIWTTQDPYNSLNPGVLINNSIISNYWKTNNLSVQANLVHVINAHGEGGVANYNSLSGAFGGIHDGNRWGPFAGLSVHGDMYLLPFESDSLLRFDFDVHTIAHEMGHNFNCPHTHSCSWNPMIDTCATDEGISGGCLNSNQQRVRNDGSIMSYCREINNWVSKMTLLARPALLIRNYAESCNLKEANSNTNKPTTVPILVRPKKDTSDVPITPTFIWKSDNINYDIIEAYHFQLSTSDNFSSFIVDTIINDTTFFLSSLNEGTDYYWRVATKNYFGESPFSNTWKFTTEYSVPDAPELLSPQTGDTILIKHDTIDVHGDITVKDTIIGGQFIWSGKSSIDYYQLRISTEKYSDVFVIDSTDITDTTYQSSSIMVLEPKQYYWQVKAYGKGGESEWSNYGRFRIVVETSITGVEESANKNLEVNIYPNPANDKLNIMLILPYNSEITIAVHDILGNRLYQEIGEIKQSGSNIITIPITNLHSGLFNIQIRTNKDNIIRTFCVFR